MRKSEREVLNENYRVTKTRGAIREALYRAVELEKNFDKIVKNKGNPYGFCDKSEYLSDEFNKVTSEVFSYIENLNNKEK